MQTRTRRGSKQSNATTSQPSSLSGNNSTSTEDEGSVASALSGLSLSEGLQSPGASASTRSVRSTNSSRSRTRNPLRSNARGFSEPVLKEVVNDIEDNGGLRYILSTTTGLTNFFNQRVEEGKEAIYGVRGTPARDKIANKVRTWYRLPEEEYKEILLHCAVTPAELRPNFAQEYSQAAPPQVVSVPGVKSPRGKIKGTPRAGTTARTPRAKATAATPDTAAADSTPKNSNVRNPRGGFSFSDYREPKQALSDSDEEIHSKRRGKMSIQRPDDIPVGKLRMACSLLVHTN